MAKKSPGRPRTVSDVEDATGVTVRFPNSLLAKIDEMAAAKGQKRSDFLRDLVAAAIERATKPAPPKKTPQRRA